MEKDWGIDWEWIRRQPLEKRKRILDNIGRYIQKMKNKLNTKCA